MNARSATYCKYCRKTGNTIDDCFAFKMRSIGVVRVKTKPPRNYVPFICLLAIATKNAFHKRMTVQLTEERLPVKGTHIYNNGTFRVVAHTYDHFRTIT